ncbi:hypothetical protein SRHO_G00311980 [Serrasalmus rhombeus]
MVFLNFGRFVLQRFPDLSSVRPLSLSARRNAVVVERWWQVPLSKEGRPPRLYGRRHRIYRLVEDTKHKPQEKMELLLTQTVPTFQSAAVTEEQLNNLESARNEPNTIRQTKRATVEFLKKAKLEVGMPTSVPYQLTKEVVCRHFLRSLGLVVPTQALTLSEEPITGLGDYWCEVTVNGVDTVRVPMSVVPFVEPRQRKRLKQEEQQPDPE